MTVKQLVDMASLRQVGNRTARPQLTKRRDAGLGESVGYVTADESIGPRDTDPEFSYICHNWLLSVRMTFKEQSCIMTAKA
jgi:hypothetical protein